MAAGLASRSAALPPKSGHATMPTPKPSQGAEGYDDQQRDEAEAETDQEARQHLGGQELNAGGRLQEEGADGPVSGSRTAAGYCTGVQASSLIVAMARFTDRFLASTRENRTPAARQAATTGLVP